MSWNDDNPLLGKLGATKESIFAIHGDLDGEKQEEFQERERFIGLIVGSEEFLLPISAVREIIMLSPITFVPNAPPFVDGVINLRGSIIPAVNMRKMMGLPRGEATGVARGNQASAPTSARIIIVRFEGITFALIVDGITYVIALLPSDIETQSLPGKSSGAEFIGSVSKQGSKICGILDLQRILMQTGGLAEHEAGDDGDNQATGDTEGHAA